MAEGQCGPGVAQALLVTTGLLPSRLIDRVDRERFWHAFDASNR